MSLYTGSLGRLGDRETAWVVQRLVQWAQRTAEERTRVDELQLIPLEGRVEVLKPWLLNGTASLTSHDEPFTRSCWPIVSRCFRHESLPKFCSRRCLTAFSSRKKRLPHYTTISPGIHSVANMEIVRQLAKSVQMVILLAARITDLLWTDPLKMTNSSQSHSMTAIEDSKFKRPCWSNHPNTSPKLSKARCSWKVNCGHSVCLAATSRPSSTICITSATRSCQT